MTHLLFMGAGPMLTPLEGKSVPDIDRRVDSEVWGAVQRSDAPDRALS
jgi:hypothetical protein